MFRWQEYAIARLCFTNDYFFDVICNIGDPFFKINGEWYFPSRNTFAALAHETRQEFAQDPLPRPSHIREGLDGPEVEIPDGAFR